MRVIAGKYKGRTLDAPQRALTRPVTDRAREGLFNALGSMGGIEGKICVDLFAGSGSLGIEALSRGAKGVTFVDHHADAIATIEKNLKSISAEGWNTKRSDVISFTSTMKPVDVVFIDPPFAISDEQWRDVLENVKTEIIVAESNRDISPLFPATYPDLRVRTYGDSVVVIATTSDHVDADAQEEQT